MPPRLVCVAILLYWVVAASSLIRRDLLPELRFARPPDLLSIARAVRSSGPSRWSVLVIDDPAHPDIRRSVGEAVNESIRQHDGAVLMSSRVRFDSGGLLRGTAFAFNWLSGVNLRALAIKGSPDPAKGQGRSALFRPDNSPGRRDR